MAFPVRVIAFVGLAAVLGHRDAASAQSARQIPDLQVDPSWPQLPENWILGASAGIATDSARNVWFIHRPGSATEKKACCRPAPVVMQFDPTGKLLQSWEDRKSTRLNSSHT